MMLQATVFLTALGAEPVPGGYAPTGAGATTAAAAAQAVHLATTYPEIESRRQRVCAQDGPQPRRGAGSRDAIEAPLAPNAYMTANGSVFALGGLVGCSSRLHPSRVN